jgi:galactokinase
MLTGATVIARAPGRVNLIGDHTDHTGGFCLPIAIDRWVEVEVERQPGRGTVRLHSEAEASAAEVALGVTDPAHVEPGWARYVAGVVERLHPAYGATGTVRSTIPAGAGLSSSAALEVACALALGADATDRLALAVLCREAEHAARGVPTGLLDQLACVFGVAGHALLLDCSTNAVRPTPLPPPDELAVVVVVGGPRSLAATPYAQRVGELRRVEADIGPLRAAGPDDVERVTDPVLRRRASHVVSENARVHQVAAALAAGRLVEVGRLLDESHRSLRDDFESSSPAVDAIWAELRAVPGVYGARITGGGWGGSVVALARPGALDGRGWLVRPVDGASVEPVARLGARPPG